MLKREENERVTRSGPGTPLGGLMRAYWQPAALVSEMSPERRVKPVRLLGEDLVLFGKPDGSWALVGRFCAHRGVDLAFARHEEGGLRCLYHGWLYGSDGRCKEQPAEPAHSRFAEKVRIPSYPCQERNGIVFAYLGEGDPPPLPGYDAFTAPDAYTFAFKGLWECNWLQGLEGGIDPSHVSFLHRFIDEDPREVYGQQFSEVVEGTGQKLSKLVGDAFRPDIEVEDTEYGLRVYALRRLTDEIKHVRITNLVFPNAFVVPFGNSKVFIQWHVPIDDHHHYWYMIFYDFAEPTDKQTLLAQRLSEVSLPDYRPLRNRANNWGYDPAEQRDLTYTGMGLDINVHDQWAVESMATSRTARPSGSASPIAR
jgi:phthalate 4,5-dioxygenase oxygenase subunit